MSELNFSYELDTKPREVIGKNLKSELESDPKANISESDIQLSLLWARSLIASELCKASFFWGEDRKRDLIAAIHNCPDLGEISSQLLKESESAIAHH